jgi:hypothetical protein
LLGKKGYVVVVVVEFVLYLIAALSLVMPSNIDLVGIGNCREGHSSMVFKAVR